MPSASYNSWPIFQVPNVGQRVSRKSTEELGTVTEIDGQIKVKWDSGRTSYFRHGDEANVELIELKQRGPPRLTRRQELINERRARNTRSAFTREVLVSGPDGSHQSRSFRSACCAGRTLVLADEADRVDLSSWQPAGKLK